MQFYGLDSVENVNLKFFDLLLEFFFDSAMSQILDVCFAISWSNQCKAVPLLKEAFK